MPQRAPAAQRRPRPGGRSSRVVASVLASTIDALIDRGYQDFSIYDVAARAGVHDSSIYRRWGTKAQLVSEAVIRYGARDIPAIDTGSFRGDVSALLRRVIRFAKTPLGTAVGQVVASQDPDLAGVRKAYWNSRVEIAREIVARAVARGELSPSVDPRMVMEMTSGPVLLRLISGELVTPRYIKKLAKRVMPIFSE